MKKNKLLLIASVILSTACFGAAQAADVTTWSGLNTTDNILIKNDIQAEGTPQIINISGGSAQIIDGGGYSLTGAAGYYINAGSKPELTIQNFGSVTDGTAESHTFSYTDANGDIVYKTISKSINGFSQTPIQTGNLSKLTVQDVAYKDNVGSSLTLLNVSLQNATDTASIKDVVFYGNKITSNSYEGALLCITNGTVEIDNLVFDSNEIGIWALGLDFYAGTHTNIKNSIFQNNKSGAFGVLQLSGGEVFIDNSQFINNNCRYADGGAITVTSKLQNVTNSIFKNNIAAGAGGAIWYSQLASSPYFVNTTFEGNTAGDAGGALFIGGTSASTGTVYLDNSLFKDNESPYGGGIYSYYTPNFYVVDTDFIGNTADEGGGIYAERENLNIFANTKNVTFSGNTANNTDADYNGGSAVYYDVRNVSNIAFNINAASGRKVIFDDSIATYSSGADVIMNINKSGLSYEDINGDLVTITNGGEIQFNDRVGDGTQYFTSINLYGGKLSIGQNADNNALTTNPDGYLNDNKFYVRGNSTLNTVNGKIGNFAPRVFNIDSGVSLDYMFDVDLANVQSDTLGITLNEGTLQLSSFNVISDSDADGLRIKYSDTNVGGVVKDGYTITTSTNTYDVTADNDSTGSYVIFTQTGGGGGLPSAIAAGADQYIITDGQDENVTAWTGAAGNVINNDMDINGNGNSIYTENGINGIVVSAGNNVTFRDIETLSGFNNALTNNGGNLSIVDSNITGNSGTADITNNSGVVCISAVTKDIVIGSDNTTNALLSDGGAINVTGSNIVTFNGSVTGSNDAIMNIAADTIFGGDVSDMNIFHSAGNVEVTNLTGSDYTLSGGTLNLNESGSFAPNNFELNDGMVNIADEAAFSPLANTLNGGSISAVNDSVGNLNFNSLTLGDVINLAVDVDMNGGAMDTISATSVSGDGAIKINQFNIISETNSPSISLSFAGDELKDRVSTDITTLEGKIFKYNVGYDSDNGQFTFAGGGKNSKGYSPSVMASPVAAQLQGYFTQLSSYDEAFRNMDMYMLLPRKTRQALKDRNRVAINSPFVVYDKAKNVHEDKTAWVRTRTTFEKVPLKNGPKVNNISYGTYVGGESEMYDLGKGWDGRYGVYVGYNGSHQSYDGISMYQNGGTLGLVGMAYKGNFFQGLTINAGANGGEAYTNFGHENFSMLMAGIASKTGYNIEFKEGKYIVQPSLLMSYSFVNSFDYVNAAGVNISSDPLHAIQVEPNVKFIANLKNSWQPYASVGMVWNIMDSTHYMANSVSLPELSVKPYVKYGIGIRKVIGESFTGFFQTYLTHGGRNGIGLQVGLRWALGGRKSTPRNVKL